MREKGILVIDDDTIILDSLCEFLTLEGFRARGAETLKGALAELGKRDYCLVLTDVNLPDGDGLELVDMIRRDYPQTVVIVITGYATLESEIHAMRQGALYYIAKPFNLDEIRKVTKEAIEKVRLKKGNIQLRKP